MDARQTEEILRKYYFVAMALSSVFCVHSEMRINSHDIQTLGHMFRSLAELQQTLGIRLPQIKYLCKDSESVNSKDGTDIYQLVLGILPEKLRTAIRERLEILPRGKPGDLFLQSGKIQDLQGTSYLRNINDLL